MDLAQDELLNCVDWCQINFLIKKYIIQKFDKNLNLEIDDLVQEISIKLISKLHMYSTQKGSFNSWLRVLTINYVVDQLRKKRNLLKKENEYFSNIISTEESELESYYQKIDNELLKLKEIELQILNLRFYQNKKYKEISIELNIPTQHLPVILARLLKKIRKNVV